VVALQPLATPEDLERGRALVLARQSLLRGGVAGAVAAAIGGGVWAGIALVSHYELGYLAIGIGFIVGAAVRYFGAARSPIFGGLSAILSLGGLLTGKILIMLGFFIQGAIREGSSFGEALDALPWESLPLFFQASFAPMDLLFYGLALWCGWKYGWRPVSIEEAQAARDGG
jgi:hypothetical protein